jgi:hypothetical protein
MGRLMLDIGAGGSSFARRFLDLNPHLDLSILCGEPHYGSVMDRCLSWGRIQKVKAAYENFELPPDSLDMVTLNAYNPLCALGNIGKEVLRCLKSGGIFFSAHPIGLMPEIIAKELARSPSAFLFHKTGCIRHEVILKLGEEWGTIRYPASPTIEERFRVLEYPERFEGRLGNYLYRHPGLNSPSLNFWVKQ